MHELPARGNGGADAPAALVRAPSGAAARRGRSAGLILGAASLAIVPSALFVDGVSPAALATIVVFGAVCGLGCLVIPWQRLAPAWINAVPIAATLQVTALAIAVSQTYELLYLPIATLAAHAIGGRRATVAHLALIVVCMLLPLAVDPASWRMSLQLLLILAPITVFGGAFALRVREGQEAKDRNFRVFSTEVQALASRMLGRAGHLVTPEQLPWMRPDGEAAEDPITPPDGAAIPTNGDVGSANGGVLLPHNVLPLRSAPRLAFLATSFAILAATGSLAFAGAAFQHADPRGGSVRVTASPPPQEPARALLGPVGALVATTVDEEAPQISPRQRAGGTQDQVPAGAGGNGPREARGGPGDASHNSPPSSAGTATASAGPPAVATPSTAGAPSQAGTPPGHGGAPPGHGGTPPGQVAGAPPGHGGTPPGHTAGATPGHGGTPPGHGGTPPGQVTTPPGQVKTPPGQVKDGGAPPPAPPPGQEATAPGQEGEPPGQPNA